MEGFPIQKMKIEINNRQRLRQVNKQKIKKLTLYLMDQANNLDHDKGWNEVSLVFTDDKGIRVVNQVYFSKGEPTDVISLAYDPIPGEEESFSGEIIVNVEQALKHGSEKWSEDKELALYLAHGCDHLMGETDLDEAGRKRMRARELRWLKKAEESGLIEELI